MRHVSNLTKQGVNVQVMNKRDKTTSEYQQLYTKLIPATHEFWVQTDDKGVLSLLEKGARLCSCRSKI